MNNKIIEGIALKKIYRMGDIDIHALDGVDFEIFEGEFIVILGPSGSGKSRPSRAAAESAGGCRCRRCVLYVAFR